MLESYCKHAKEREVKRLERRLSFYGASRINEDHNYDCKLTGKVCIVDLIERLTGETKYRGDYFLFRCPGVYLPVINRGKSK